MVRLARMSDMRWYGEDDMGRLIEVYRELQKTEYEQGWRDGTQAAEQSAMELVAVLVNRLGGRVVISDKDFAEVNWRKLHWRDDPVSQNVTYEVKDD